MQKLLGAIFYNKWTTAIFFLMVFGLILWGCSKIVSQQVEDVPPTPEPTLQDGGFSGNQPEMRSENESNLNRDLPNEGTQINQCSPDGFATAREGPGLEYPKMAPIYNGTKVEILNIKESNDFDFTPGVEGCSSSVRVLIRVLEGDFKTQESWVHGATVEGVAK